MTTATKPRRKSGTTWRVAATELLAALRAVAPAVGRDGTLANVRIGDTVQGFNGELRVAVDLGAWDTAILVPHGRLMAILATVRGEVEIEQGATSVTVTAARGRWTLPTENANEFPVAATTARPAPLATIPADQFVRSVRAVLDAADSESSRYALGGVLLEHRGPHVAFVATDGRRLHLAVVDVDQATDDRSVIVPRAAMATLAKLAAEAGDGAVALGVSGSDLVADFESATVHARLLDGRFPRWLDIVPVALRPRLGSDDDTYREPPAHAEVTAGELLAAVRQAAIVTSEQSKAVTFAFTREGLCLTARSSEAGESTVTADLSTADITAVVRLDPQFVTQWLKTLDPAAAVEIFATDSDAAVVLRHEDAIGVVMPMAAE